MQLITSGTNMAQALFIAEWHRGIIVNTLTMNEGSPRICMYS